MLGRLGLKLFLIGLFATIVFYHFVASVWRLPLVPILCIGFMGLGLILWFVFSIEWLIGFIQKRSSQYSFGVIASVIGVVGILCVLNWVSIEKNKKWDLTRSGIHSLSDQTIKILKNLKEPVTLEVWTMNVKDMSGGHDMGRFLENYVQNSNGKVKLAIRNPNSERPEALQNKITRKDTIIAKAESGRESRIDSFSDAKAEEQITNAIVQAVKGQKKIICSVVGHGELAAQQGEPGTSISLLKQALEGNSYTVREVTLATEKKRSFRLRYLSKFWS